LAYIKTLQTTLLKVYWDAGLNQVASTTHRAHTLNSLKFNSNFKRRTHRFLLQSLEALYVYHLEQYDNSHLTNGTLVWRVLRAKNVHTILELARNVGVGCVIRAKNVHTILELARNVGVGSQCWRWLAMCWTRLTMLDVIHVSFEVIFKFTSLMSIKLFDS
jgi:hypothetical protein